MKEKDMAIQNETVTTIRHKGFLCDDVVSIYISDHDRNVVKITVSREVVVKRKRQIIDVEFWDVKKEEWRELLGTSAFADEEVDTAIERRGLVQLVSQRAEVIFKGIKGATVYPIVVFLSDNYRYLDSLVGYKKFENSEEQ
jgi:hypothetical protein